MPGTKYLPNWHLEAIAWQLQCVLNGDIKRLLITMPQRSLKSIFASVALPAFALGHYPSKRIVCVSYAEDLAAKHARDCRAVLETGWYRHLFPASGSAAPDRPDWILKPRGMAAGFLPPWAAP